MVLGERGGEREEDMNSMSGGRDRNRFLYLLCGTIAYNQLQAILSDL